MFLYLSQKEQTSSLCTCVLNTVLLHKLFVYSCLSFCWYVSSTNMPFNNVVSHTKDSEYISLMKPFKYRVELTKRKPTTIQLGHLIISLHGSFSQLPTCSHAMTEHTACREKQLNCEMCWGVMKQVSQWKQGFATQDVNEVKAHVYSKVTGRTKNNNN